MPTYLYKPVNNTIVTLLGTDIRVPTDGLSFNADNTQFNGYVPEVLDRYIDGVLDNNIVQVKPSPQIDPLTDTQLRAAPVSVATVVKQAVPDFRTPNDLVVAFGNFDEVNPVDFVTRVSYSNGQAVTALSADPITPGESRVMLNVPIYQPGAFEVEASVIRNRQQFTTFTLFSNGDDGIPAPVPSPINIVNISQSSATAGASYTGSAGTSVTVLLESPLPEYPNEAAVYLSDWVNITGLVDSRLNYQNACINWISADRKTFTFGFSDEAALPSLAIAVVTPPLGSAKVNFYNNMGGAAEGFGIRFTGTTTTSAAIVSLFGNGDAQVSGTLFGDHRVSVSSSAPQYLNGVMGNVELKAASRYRLEARPTEAAVLDKAIESASSPFTARVARTAVKPAYHLPLYPRMRVYQPVGMSRPTDKITAISKSGTTTATVTHTGTRVYQVGEVVGIYGVRDATNFAQATATIASVISATQFTCVLGSAVTASSYGGSVCITNGGAVQPGIIGQNVQSVAQLNINLNWLVVVGNTTWSGLSIGDYVNLHGVRNSAGADLALDGAWEVAHLSTSTMYLKPITDLFGVRRTPVMPAIGTTAVNAGGSVILRTTARVHDLMLEEWQENKVMIDGQGTSRTDKALPIYGLGGTLAVTQSTAASISTSGLGGWYIHPAIVGIADIASAALTATNTGSAISNALGNGFQVTIPVIAVSGTSSTMDVRIEESFDGGTNWVTLYEFQRITANGSYNSPILRASGRHIRYVRTLGGTSPSFTHSVTRNTLPFIQAEPQKRIIDRTIVPNTLNSTTPVLFQGAANNIQLVVNMGAITTTAPQFQLEGSEDGTNWYSIGTPLLAVASSTVEVTVNKSATFVRARVSTAGSGTTLGYVSIKAWS